MTVQPPLQLAYARVSDAELRVAVRRLLLAVVLQAAADAVDGDDPARAWLEGEGAVLLRQALGMSLTVAQLLQLGPDTLRRALGERARHCWDCAWCRRDGDRCRCALGQWRARGQRDEYAALTVRKNVRAGFEACELWTERVEEDDDED